MKRIHFLPTLPSLLTRPGVPFIHRDISWLLFNERVLNEARDSSNPPLERLKFLGITASNLDEFFMIRYPSLLRSISNLEKSALRPQDKTALRSLKRINSSVQETVSKFGVKQADTLDILAGDLASERILIVRSARPSDEAYAQGRKVFEDQILPHLALPEKLFPEQLLSLLNLQMGVVFENGNWFKIPKNLPQIFWNSEKKSGPIEIFFLDDLLATHLGSMYGYADSPGILRITRDGDVLTDLEEEDPESIPDVVKSRISRREKSHVTRIQYAGGSRLSFLSEVSKVFKIPTRQILQAPSTLCMHGLAGIIDQIPIPVRKKKNRSSLRYPPLKECFPKEFSDADKIFKKIRKSDILLHHPYDSFDAFLIFIKQACKDPKVQKIELTVYRTDKLSPVINEIKKVSKTKKVTVLIELRARFDELNNLKMAEELRKAGAQVGFGLPGLKMHAKFALITRQEGSKTRLYTHLSTGNYHAGTARQYTDLAILTAHPGIGKDVRYFFDQIISGNVPKDFKTLVSAPAALHRRIRHHIDQEIKAARQGKEAGIFAKVNALVDEDVIEKLYEASSSGVRINLLVRGACSLVPGLKGLSDHIRVISIVDRFLEHSRIYYFRNSRKMYFSSADWMPRNFFSRLEIAFPVLDKKIFDFVSETLIPTYLKDNVKAKELTPQGTWKSIPRKGKAFRTQFFFANLAEKKSRRKNG